MQGIAGIEAIEARKMEKMRKREWGLVRGNKHLLGTEVSAPEEDAQGWPHDANQDLVDKDEKWGA